jgi:hypothetical protein
MLDAPLTGEFSACEADRFVVYQSWVWYFVGDGSS